MQGAHELCGICGNALRPGVRFCGRCGAEQGFAVARDAGAGRALRDPVVGPRLHVGDAGLTIALVAYFAMLAPAVILLVHGDADLDDLMWGQLAIGAVGVIGCLWMWRDALPLLRGPRITARDVALGAGGIVATLAVALGMSRLLPDFFVADTWLYQVEGKTLAYALLHAAVIPAVVEELAFRGVVLTGLRAVFKDRLAVAVSAMMFAILHLTPLSFPHLLLLGVLLGAARLRTGSVWPCVAIHGVYNALVLVLQW